MIDRTEMLVGEEQCDLKRGRGCVYQIFALNCISERYIKKGREVYFAFMDLWIRLQCFYRYIELQGSEVFFFLFRDLCYCASGSG